jgi:hypothetical protein
MRQEVKLTDAIGKTLEGAAFSTCSRTGQAVLTFSDGTFTTLGVSRGYEAGDEEIAEEELSLFNFGDDDLIEVGVVTAEELQALRAARDAESSARLQAVREARDRQEFERLKLKFGLA